jgi:hypothetical protein
MMIQQPDDEHYRLVANRLMAGAVVPFLGAGVGLCGRPAEVPWELGRYLPSGKELAEYLARDIDYPAGEPFDLLRVCQYVDVKLGNGPLYEALHAVFDADYAPKPYHRLLASLPERIRTVRGEGLASSAVHVTTTNYDSLLEQALRDAEEYDLVTYMAEGPDKHRVRSYPPRRRATLITVANSYPELRCDKSPVVAKIHGAVGRRTDERDSFVITENHYIAYLSRADIPKLIPVNLATRMRKSHFLFLGYSLKDWNLRVILHRLWGDEGLDFNSWAVQPHPDKIEERAWYRRGVELLDSRLEEYTEELERALTALMSMGVEA